MELHKVGDKAVVLEESGMTDDLKVGDVVFVAKVDKSDELSTYAVSQDLGGFGLWIENSNLNFDFEEQLSLNLDDAEEKPESKYKVGDVVYVIGDGEYWVHDQEATILEVSGQEDGVIRYHADFNGDWWSIDDSDIKYLVTSEEMDDAEEKVEPVPELNCMADKELESFIDCTKEKVECIEQEIEDIEGAVKSLQEQIHERKVNLGQMKGLVYNLKNLLQSRID